MYQRPIAARQRRLARHTSSVAVAHQLQLPDEFRHWAERGLARPARALAFVVSTCRGYHGAQCCAIGLHSGLPPPTHRTALELSLHRNRVCVLVMSVKWWACRLLHEGHGEGGNTNVTCVWPPVACVRPPEV